MNKKVYFAVGDTVRVNLTHFEFDKKEDFDMVVTRKIKRYSYNDHDFVVEGKLLNPIPCRFCENNVRPSCSRCGGTGVQTTRSCASQFVKERIAIGKNVCKTKENIYKSNTGYFVEKNKKVLFGSFCQILGYALSKIDNRTIDRPISDKAFSLFHKNPLGLIRVDRGNNCYHVNFNKFKKWVHSNVDRLMESAKATGKINDQMNAKIEAEYYSNCIVEYKQD
jgi:hypothetical protein